MKAIHITRYGNAKCFSQKEASKNTFQYTNSKSLNFYKEKCRMKNLTSVLIGFIVLSQTVLTMAASSYDASLEHIKAKFPMNYTGRVTPLPKEVLSKWELISLAKGGLNVKIASSTHNAIKLAHDLLMQRVTEYSKKAKNFSDKKITVFLGEINSAFIRDVARRLKINLDNVKLQDQGYVIRRKGNSILIAGKKHRGTFYGAMTIYQSIGAPNGKFILRCAELNDWPTWKQRYFASYPVPGQDELLSLAMYKMGLCIQTRGEWRNIISGKKGRGIYFKKGDLKSLKKFNEKYDLMDYMFIINIYAHSKPIIDIANDKDIKQLLKTCLFLAKNGIRHILIGADDRMPTKRGRYVCYHSSEKKRFNNSPGRAHGYLMRFLHNKLKTQYPDLTLALIPPPYSLYQHCVDTNLARQAYLRDMSKEMPDDVFVLWTGTMARSWDIKKEDFIKWQSYVNKPKIHLWDNTGYPTHIRRWSTRFYDGMALDNKGVIYLNGDMFGATYRIPFYMNANDYLWNPKAYQEKASYRDVVEKLYGVGSYKKVDKFIEKSKELLDETLEQKKVLALLDELEALSAKMEKGGWSMSRINKYLKGKRKLANIVVPYLKVSRFSDAPVLDGKLDDACWKKSSSFQMVPVSGKNEKNESTVCYFGYDDKNLYLGVDAKRSVALKDFKKVKHDSKVWTSEDSFQMFFQGERKAFYAQLIFDTAGNQADKSFVRARSGAWNAFFRWNPVWTVKINPNKKGWSAEVIIPFTSMVPVIEQPVKSRTVWRANFIRSSPETSKPVAWSPTNGNGYHTKSVFGKLIFE